MFVRMFWINERIEFHMCWCWFWSLLNMHVLNKKYKKQKTNNTKIQTAWSSVKYLIIVYRENPPWAEQLISLLYWHCIESLEHLNGDIRSLRWNVIPWSSVPKFCERSWQFLQNCCKMQMIQINPKFSNFPIVSDLRVHVYSKNVEIHVQ